MSGRVGWRERRKARRRAARVEGMTRRPARPKRMSLRHLFDAARNETSVDSTDQGAEGHIRGLTSSEGLPVTGESGRQRSEQRGTSLAPRIDVESQVASGSSVLLPAGQPGTNRGAAERTMGISDEPGLPDTSETKVLGIPPRTNTHLPTGGGGSRRLTAKQRRSAARAESHRKALALEDGKGGDTPVIPRDGEGFGS
jgi:hypothetical protein